MTFIDLASLGCGRYEGLNPKTQFWPTVSHFTKKDVAQFIAHKMFIIG